MNLISGKLLDKQQSLKELDTLYDTITSVLAKDELSSETVIAACESLSKTLTEDKYIPILLSLGIPEYKAHSELEAAKQMLNKEYLEKRIKMELPQTKVREFVPYGRKTPVKNIVKPLGVLFHIVAGNVDALPVFSVIEGLLTGNINILKLPGNDNGLSIAFLKKLVEIEPQLKDYIYVFDYPSDEIESMQKMALLSDAIIIWGGDSAVESVRKMAKPDTKIIEWGHKISFGYVSGNNINDEELDMAWHTIFVTQTSCTAAPARGYI
ncbi:MAG: hypothetical protein JXN65_03685 [Clostridia bacterium]|nr:hypothetical protein [Clostridia bacterium]